MSDNTSQELRHYARYDAPLRRRALIYRAADEIDYLRARVVVLEAALRHYADDDYNGHNANGSCARAALKEVKP
jgi:hypothetical protein